ncbi:Cysteine-rich protein [Spironucleus salmonicida]|uniref:Cysteine-rich protein n=1 Tax=Spironucleus salmonicida TaxID=348837 RepID=V6LSL4_9EUKA|nr:Cysteine-rich protein [Spironucleus salmonicida]|eukprot:EST46666.1 Cysteine-rich protein [Spironucleus salmonicida]
MNQRCSYCASEDHTITSCPKQKQCFICLKTQCNCIKQYLQKIDKSLLQKQYVNECYRCNGDHTIFECPENDELQQKFDILSAIPVQVIQNGYQFGKMSLKRREEKKGNQLCCICGGTSHDSRGCQSQNFRLHFSERVYK